MIFNMPFNIFKFAKFVVHVSNCFEILNWSLKTEIIKTVTAHFSFFSPFSCTVMLSLLSLWALSPSLFFLCFAVTGIRYGKDISCGPFLPRAPVILSCARAGRQLPAEKCLQKWNVRGWKFREISCPLCPAAF